MKAYINESNVVIAIGENDLLFQGCNAVEVSQNEIDFINQCKLPKYNGDSFFEGLDINYLAELELEKETIKYLQRSKDGLEAYARISAEFRLAKQAGQISEETHAYIEKMLIPVRNEVLAGQWMSGLNELVAIGPELIGQELYNRLYTQISNYIDLNYSSLEQQQSLSLTSKK